MSFPPHDYAKIHRKGNIVGILVLEGGRRWDFLKEIIHGFYFM
jgi:hypothetical protein